MAVFEDPRWLHALDGVAQVLQGASADEVEDETLDFKEDLTRRDDHGDLGPGDPLGSDQTQRQYADECNCLANHEGGSLIIGVNDRGTGPEAILGTDLDATHLITRIRELTDPPLTVTAREHEVAGKRLLVLLVPRNNGAEPHGVRMAKKQPPRYSRRVAKSCQGMDFRELMQWGQGRSGYDWSAGPSGLGVADARLAAVEALRDFLRESREPSRLDLAERDTTELLGQLQLLRDDGTLNRAGALLLCASPSPRLVYLHRSAAGARSTARIERTGQGLLEELRRTLDAFESNNAVTALSMEGLTQGAVTELPALAVREALINGVMHRDWELTYPVVVEHVGSGVTVQSPGGFFGGVTADTVLTAASVTRNRRLSDALRSLRLAEREGVGVDRMFIEMVRLGHSPPAFAERDGGVRVSLQGGPPVPSVLQAHAKLPTRLREDARMSVAIDMLRKKPSVTAGELAAAAQQPEADLAPFLESAQNAGVLRRTARPRPGGIAAWRLHDDVRAELGSVLPYYSRPAEQAIEEIARLAREQGNVRNKDVQDLLGVSPNRASDLLALAAQEGLIQLADNAKPTGRGTYYVPTA